MTTLHAARLIDTPAEDAFDRLTRLAARLLGAPVALVTLAGPDRMFVKSAVGLAEPLAGGRSIPLSRSFCRHVVASRAPLVVEDARRHPLLRASPSIHELGWIGYAGVPLTTPDGRTVGALAVIDMLPRIWSPRDLALLEDLAASVVTEIEIRARAEAGDGVFEASALPMGLLLQDGRWLRVNRALAELLGTIPEALDGCPADASTHPADRSADVEAMRLLQAGECTSYRSEKRLIGEGPEPIWVVATVTALPGGAGEGPGYHVALQDISDRRRAELELRASEERFRLASATTLDAVWDWDLLTDRIAWEERAGGPFGYHQTAPGLLAAWWYERLHGDDRDRVVSGVHAAIAGGALAWGDAYRFRRADGGYANVRDRAAILRDEGGDAVRLVGAVVDVTEQTQAELQLSELAVEQDRSRQALARGVQLFEQVLDALPVGVWVLERDGKIMFGNPAGRAIWGGARDAGLGPARSKGWWADSGEPIAAEQWGAARAIRDGVTSLDEVVQIEGYDGTQKTILSSAVPLRGLDGTILGAILVHQDITEQRAAQAALRQSEERLRHAQQTDAVGRLAGGIAHDFNNLLTGILSYADLVLQELRQSDPIRADVEQIRRAGERATSLTRQLLALSRRQVLQPRVLSLNRVVAEVEATLRRLLGTGVSLGTELDAGLGCVLADPGQVEQVLVNLAVNARDAMPDGGRLTIATANVNIEAVGDSRGDGTRLGRYVTVTVGDTGAGMDVATQARMFEPFFTTRPAGKGTGLGLSTVYGIVEQSGGHIAVESAPGLGTRLTIFLPRHEGPDLAEPDWTGRRGLPRGTETVLLVEDEAAVRDSARRLLEHQGYTVVEARNGADALRIADAGEVPIDLVLTDLVMPEMGGRELVEHLRSRRPDAKVLYMSGYSEHAVTVDGVMPPATGFMEKPFTVEQLSRLTREILDG